MLPLRSLEHFPDYQLLLSPQQLSAGTWNPKSVGFHVVQGSVSTFENFPAASIGF